MREKIRLTHRQGLSAAATQSEHRPDPAGTLSEMAALKRSRDSVVCRLAARLRRQGAHGFSPKSGSLAWRQDFLVAGRNFGGGSSREAAVYAIYDYGFRCVIAPSFGDIFAQNAVKNGLLTAVVSEGDAAELAAAVAADPGRDVIVDLEQRTIQCGNRVYSFSIDLVSRNQLLNGWDDVDLTESFRTQISTYPISRPTTKTVGKPSKIVSQFRRFQSDRAVRFLTSRHVGFRPPYWSHRRFRNRD